MPRKQAQKSEILYGLHPVTEAFRAGRRRVERLYLTPAAQKSSLTAIIESLKTPKTAVETVAPAMLTQLCENSRHQGICARVSAFPWTPLEKVLSRPPRTGRHPVLLALDCLTDPHNVGALLRTALVSGVDGVLLPRRNTCGPTPTVSKVSAGALEHSTVVPVTNLVRALDQLKAKDFWVFGLDRDGSQPLYATDFNVPLVLVIGGEKKGLRPLVKTHCDYLACIPQLGPLDSLNASVAGAVALYEILRQRRAEGSP